MNGAGIGIPALITIAARRTIRLVLRGGRPVCGGEVAGAVVPSTAGLRVGTPTTRATAAAISASVSAGLQID